MIALLNISFAMLKYPQSLLIALLPENYAVMRNPDNEEEFFVGKSLGDFCEPTRVGTARFVGGCVEFDFEKSRYGQIFERDLYERYPEIDPDRFVWALFRSHYMEDGEWVYFMVSAQEPEPTKEDASIGGSDGDVVGKFRLSDQFKETLILTEWCRLDKDRKLVLGTEVKEVRMENFSSSFNE